MSRSYENSSRLKSLLTTQNLILVCIGWAVLALLYFSLFGVKTFVDGKEIRAEWYTIGTNIFEGLAYLGASLLCWRNWRSHQMVSSRKVWLFIGLGMFSYFIGGLIFGYTEVVLKQEPDISLGDIFFVLTYITLGIGMILALFSRRINLEAWQWIVVVAVAIAGTVLAFFVSQKDGKASGQMEQLISILNWFYIVSDVLLLIIATTMLFAFWGGKVSLSWRMIAAAAFSLYIADMWFKYAQLTQGNNYQSGDLLEVFWVFSGVLFGMGAILEYDASLSLKRRERGRKRSS